MLTVLLVESDADTGHIYAEFLRHKGHQTIKAVTLAEAYALLETASFHVVVAELFMPDGPGVHFIQEMRKSDQFAHIPIIAHSTDTHSSSRRKALQAGADLFVGKPAAPLALISHIESLVSPNL
jgi:DNA-binding response OmpR family regulator